MAELLLTALHGVHADQLSRRFLALFPSAESSRTREPRPRRPIGMCLTQGTPRLPDQLLMRSSSHPDLILKSFFLGSSSPWNSYPTSTSQTSANPSEAAGAAKTFVFHRLRKGCQEVYVVQASSSTYRRRWQTNQETAREKKETAAIIGANDRTFIF